MKNTKIEKVLKAWEEGNFELGLSRSADKLGFHSNDPEFSLARELDDWFEETKMRYSDKVLSELGYFAVPSTQGCQGIDEIYDSNDKVIATLDYQEELQSLQDLYYQSDSEEEYIDKLKRYYKNILNIQ